MGRLDSDWHIGVPGWQHDGRHVRLAEIVRSDPERLLRRHVELRILLALVQLKLRHEYNEALELLGIQTDV